MSLVKSYADGKADDEAFEGAIGMGVAAFGEAWLADLGVTAPVAYGPQPAAPGPQPSDWSAVPSRPVEPAGSAPAAASPTPLVSVTLPVERVELPALGLWLVALLVGGGVVLLIWTRSRRCPMTSMTARLRSIPTADRAGSGTARARLPDRRPARRRGPRVRYTTRERSPLIETATRLQQRQDELKARIAPAPSADPIDRACRRGFGRLVRRLNDQLEEARIAAGLIPLTGTGVVLQLEDSQEPVAPGAGRGRLPRRSAGPAVGRRGAVGSRRRGRCRQWRASRPRRARSSTSAPRSR